MSSSTTSKALVTRSDALVPSSFLFLLCRTALQAASPPSKDGLQPTSNVTLRLWNTWEPNREDLVLVICIQSRVHWSSSKLCSQFRLQNGCSILWAGCFLYLTIG